MLGGSTETELLVLAMLEEARPSPRSPWSPWGSPPASSSPDDEDSSTSSSTLACKGFLSRQISQTGRKMLNLSYFSPILHSDTLQLDLEGHIHALRVSQLAAEPEAAGTGAESPQQGYVHTCQICPAPALAPDGWTRPYPHADILGLHRTTWTQVHGRGCCGDCGL